MLLWIFLSISVDIQVHAFLSGIYPATVLLSVFLGASDGYCQRVFQRGCTNLYCTQAGVGVPCCGQHFMFPVFLFSHFSG